MNKQTIYQIRTIAVYQIIGGLLGIALTVWVTYSAEMVITPLILRMGLFAGGLYVFSIVCGRMLFLNPKRGLKVSLVNQVLQVLYFSFGAYGYQYVAGLRVGIGMDMLESWIFKFRLALSSYSFNLGTDLGQKFIGVNLMALFLIFWIERLLDKVKDE